MKHCKNKKKERKFLKDKKEERKKHYNNKF